MKPTDAASAQSRANRWAWLCVTILLAAFAGLSARLITLQTSSRQRLIAYRDPRQRRTIPIPARRGLILDARGRILAGSETKPSLYADPKLLDDVDGVCAQLAPILGTEKQDLALKVKQRQHTRFVWLARNLGRTEFDAIQALSLPGLGFIDEPHRFYPSGTRLAHVLGFVGQDGKGLEGLELQYDEVLSPQAGQYAVHCDARRRPLWNTFAKKPQDGQHLILHIDLVIQGFLEDALQQAIQRYQADSGVGIAMAPHSGAVLAMANYPTFDPNRPTTAPTQARRNRCLTDPAEPGSIFKPFIMTAVLSENVAHLNEMIDCGQGVWFFGKRRIRDTRHNGLLQVEDILVKSSNIGMAHLGTRLGNELLHRYVLRFGFGKLTGIDLPGEHRGIVPPLHQWTSYSTTSVPFGQEVAVTPIQLITAFCAVASGGTLHQPKILRAIIDPNVSATEKQIPSFGETHGVVDPDVARAITQRALARVVKESHYDIQSDRYRIFGKTGTAQVPYADRRGYEPDAYLSSFVGAAPAHDPQIAVLVMIRKPKKTLGYYGGAVAGPVVREVIERALAYWNVPPDDALQG